ncbi:lytic transglycosylase domain-containing protein [Prolixibacteraceae bacterium Z1-6]|uniref:Lytic transglycosylase domain-containing protein n=1 Tax=Draconibacterium aestuarii TaxID=2998507 RepID=A0A9X3J5J8_9BACT|nr:lytic transglycosylase domain-containing protein [Prolixibacteraceae bacterium Z1-6]
MRNKKWGKVLLPVIVAANIGVVTMILSSASPETKEIIVERETRFEAPELPKTVSFSGEKMPLDRFYVKEALDRELLSNVYFHSQTIRYIKLAPRYLPIIEPILKEEGIHDDFKYLALAESGFNPRAVSPAKAVGFWQFLKGTAMDYGLEVNAEVDERYHIEKSTRAACKYLKDSYEKFGSWTLVAASYNRGMAGVQRQMNLQKQEDYYDLLITTETARYVYRIVALKLILENPEKYNFFVPESEKYPVIATKEVEITGSVVNFADFAKEHGTNYKLLKDFNPWLRENKLTYSGRKRYWVEIPQL